MQSQAVLPIPCRRDNYAYLIRDQGQCWVVDPTDAAPVRKAITQEKLELRGILATHHHPDHVGGIEELLEQQRTLGQPAPFVAGHTHDKGRIPCQDVFVDAPTGRYIETDLVVAGHKVLAAHIPGHTLGAIAWKIAGHVFTGDTLFSAGCGRIFEGTPEQMFESLRTIMQDPDDTQLWFGHEYTRQNLGFATRTQPEHPAYQKALDTLVEPSCPSTIAREREINIFVRAQNPKELGELRQLKNAT